MVNKEEVAGRDLAADPALELSAQLQRVEDKLDAILTRAEPLLKLAEGWARLRGLGRG